MINIGDIVVTLVDRDELEGFYCYPVRTICKVTNIECDNTYEVLKINHRIDDKGYWYYENELKKIDVGGI
jgi:hypothetical protein